jgi:hypothetical protein
VYITSFSLLGEWPCDDRCADCGSFCTVYHELGFRGEFTHSYVLCLACHARENCEVNLYLFNEALATIRALAIK